MGATRQKLTDRIVRDAEVAVAAEMYLWDEQVRGLALRVRREGGKSWLVKRGHCRRTLGRAPEMSVSEARAAAQHAIAEETVGLAPRRKRTATVQACLQAYLTDWAETRCKPRTLEGYRDLADRVIGPRIGSLLADKLTARDVDRLLVDLRARPATANKALALLRATMKKALRWDLRDPALGDPTEGAEAYEIAPREVALEASELALVLDGLRSVGQRWPDAAACLLVLASTGCRRDEVRLLERDWVDWSTGEIAWPDTKTGAGSLHLSPAAVRLLAEAKERHADGKPWLFRSADGTGPLARSTLYRTWAAALDVAAELGADARRLQDLRPHDLRHTFASLGLSSGLSLDDVRRLLRHRSRRSTERYARLLPSRERELALASETFLRLA